MAMKETEAKRAIEINNVSRGKTVELFINRRPEPRNARFTTKCYPTSLSITKNGKSLVIGKSLEKFDLITKTNRRHTLKTTATVEKGSIENQFTSTHTELDC
jgi:hypothetical protein